MEAFQPLITHQGEHGSAHHKAFDLQLLDAIATITLLIGPTSLNSANEIAANRYVNEFRASPAATWRTISRRTTLQQHTDIAPSVPSSHLVQIN